MECSEPHGHPQFGIPKSGGGRGITLGQTIDLSASQVLLPGRPSTATSLAGPVLPTIATEPHQQNNQIKNAFSAPDGSRTRRLFHLS